MKLLKKLRAWPEFQRKLLFWLLILLVGSGLLALFGWRAKKRLEEFEGVEIKEEIQPPPSLELKMPLPELKLEE